MKEITVNKKLKVIKLFLAGISYDEITLQVGVSKGSVVNIIDEFRDGKLPVPAGTTEYIDELRYAAVELKKHNTTVSQLKSYAKLHIKLQEMGVGSDKLEQWLDICQGIASNTVANNQFVQSALELAEVTSKSSLSYKSLIEDYTQKSKQFQVLDNQIQQENEQLSKLKHEIKEEKEKATSVLDSINAAIATAQDSFKKQKEDLKSQLDQYVAQHSISWKKVDTALVIFNTGLTKAGLTNAEIDKLSEKILAVGSLDVYIKQLEHQKDVLTKEVDKLTEDKADYNTAVKQLVWAFGLQASNITATTLMC